MTEKERYDTIIKAFAELIKERDDKISILRWQVETLEAKLKELEGNENDAE